MFDHKHYVPILRWKRAEWVALGKLTLEDRRSITPLVEPTPWSFKGRNNKPAPNPADVLTKNALDLQEQWGLTPFFVDLWHVDPSLRIASSFHPLEFLAEQARSRGLGLIPVTGLHRDRHYQAAVTSVITRDRRGACIRIHPTDVESPEFPENLSGLLGLIGLEMENADLLVDYQVWRQGAPTVAALSNLIPDIDRWRTFSVASGAFPRDLTGFTIGQHTLPRFDWMGWKAQVSTCPIPRRLPTFSDYTIQHADFAEPPEYANFSASIRYTSNDYWVIMRGESVFQDNGPGFAQWPANAQLLCSRNEYCGPKFSFGDQYIHQMGAQILSTGNAETWLRAGVNHHMVFVVRQIANLSWT
jgi:Beta protein